MSYFQERYEDLQRQMIEAGMTEKEIFAGIINLPDGRAREVYIVTREGVREGVL